MKRVAVLLDDWFEDSEFSEPVNAFKNAGHEVVVVGLSRGKVVKGKSRGTIVHVERSVREVSASEFDALFVPGGYSPDKLRVDVGAVAFAKDFMDANKPVFVICHGPQILITAKSLLGRKLTGWKSIIQDIKNAGGEFLDKEVVADGNLVSSRDPHDLPVFIRVALRKLGTPA